jgi:hypothetical protein
MNGEKKRGFNCETGLKRIAEEASPLPVKLKL